MYCIVKYRSSVPLSGMHSFDGKQREERRFRDDKDAEHWINLMRYRAKTFGFMFVVVSVFMESPVQAHRSAELFEPIPRHDRESENPFMGHCVAEILQ